MYRFAWVLGLLLWAGCEDLESYAGSYRGGVVGSDDPDCETGEVCSFIRRGFPEAMVLRLDGYSPIAPDGVAGRLTTEGYGALTNDPIRTIDALQHDQLSRYDFPGADRVRNYIYAARPTEGLLAGRDVLVFVSLVETDEVEVRVVVGHGELSEGDHFGYFRLSRQ